MTPSPEQIRAVAQAITDDLMRQDGTFDGPFSLPEDMELSFLDQNCVDMGAVARAAIAAMPASGRKAVLEEAAKVAEAQEATVWAGHVIAVTAYEMAKRDIAATFRAMAEKEPTL
jgi:hypothetical protein